VIRENRVDLYADNELVIQHALNRLKLNDKFKIVRPRLEKIGLNAYFQKKFSPKKDIKL